MEYLRQIITIHGIALFVLMLISIAAMGRIFAILSDLRSQVTAIDELVPHLRAALSTKNITKAAVAAGSNQGCIGRIMAAILSEPSHDPWRMRLIYKVNIDSELRGRLANLHPLRRLALLAIVLGMAGGTAAWSFNPTEDGTILVRALVVGVAGIAVFLYSSTLYIMLRRREIELNDTVAAEALKLIDTVARTGEELAG